MSGRAPNVDDWRLINRLHTMIVRGSTLGTSALLMAVVWAIAAQLPLYGKQRSAGATSTLTPQDRSEIQELTARYARSLGACAAEAYADLFAPTTGYFASNIRGEVVGRDRLIALVQSERHCTGAGATAQGGPATAPANAAPRPVPAVVIEMSPTGPVGRADLGAAGRYEDEYVRDASGWRFKSRTVITRPEAEANLTAQDMRALRRLAGSDLGDFDDVYVTGADGVRRFRASGVALGLSADGVTGRALLRNNGGYYEDVYVRTPEAGWRFKSRVHVADAQRAAQPAAGGGGLK